MITLMIEFRDRSGVRYPAIADVDFAATLIAAVHRGVRASFEIARPGRAPDVIDTADVVRVAVEVTAGAHVDQAHGS